MSSRHSDQFKNTFLEPYLKQAQEYDDKYGFGDRDRDREGSTFLAPLDLDEHLNKHVLKSMRGPTYVYPKSGGSAVSVPKYGMYSLMLRSTKVFVYGLPALKKMCSTAFTDGVNHYIADTFYDKLNDSVFDNPNTAGIEFVLLHEQDHKYKDHIRRYDQFDPDLTNRATDLVNNVGLQMAFTSVKPCPFLKDTGYGFLPGDVEKYKDRSELSVIEELVREQALQKNRPQEGQGKGGKGSKGGKGGGGGSGGGGSPSESSEPDNSDDPLMQSDPFEQWDPTEDDNYNEVDRHFISQEELAQVLKEVGMKDALERLGIPDPDDEDAEERYQQNLEKSARITRDAIYEAARQRQEIGDAYPGAHLVDAAVDMIDKLDKGVMRWRLKMREVVMGYSPKSKLSLDEPQEIYYANLESDIGFDPYLSSPMPIKSNDVVLGICDSSGSMSREDMREGLQELLGLQGKSKNMGDRAAEVIIMGADTAIRGEPQVITNKNIDEFMKKGLEICGRGGTDIDAVINQALDLKLIKGRNVRSIVYITDTYDDPIVTPPEKMKKYKSMKVLFLAVSGTPLHYVEKFAEGTRWADVVQIGAGKMADLENKVGMNKDTALNKKNSYGV